MERPNSSNDILVDASSVVANMLANEGNANTFDASAQHCLADSNDVFDSEPIIEKAVALIRTLKLEYPMLI
jgi:hypothetical protein